MKVNKVYNCNFLLNELPDKCANLIISDPPYFRVKGDFVVVPFAGSGTECAMAAKYGRDFIGFDIDEKHCITANKRAFQYLKQESLF